MGGRVCICTYTHAMSVFRDTAAALPDAEVVAMRIEKKALIIRTTCPEQIYIIRAAYVGIRGYTRVLLVRYGFGDFFFCVAVRVNSRVCAMDMVFISLCFCFCFSRVGCRCRE